jgi:hypothetical protein
VTAGFVGASISATMQPNGTWTLNRKLTYHSDVTDRTYVVPRGFNTDFASVPRLPVAYMLTANTAHAPAVLHDWLYRTGTEPRTVCDAIFREAMQITGVPSWRSWLMWAGVRAGGRRHHVDTTSKPANVAAPDASAKDPPGD